MKPVIFSLASGAINVRWPSAEAILLGKDDAWLASTLPASAAIVSCDVTQLPDKLWMEAWVTADHMVVTIDLVAAKVLAHDFRRKLRDSQMAVLDGLATSPIQAIQDKALADKQVVYDANAVLQTQIDVAATPDALKQLLQAAGAI